MKLYIDGDDVFFPITDFYLVWICKKWELKVLTLEQIKLRVDSAIASSREQ